MGLGDLIDGIQAMLTMTGLGKLEKNITANNYAVPLVGATNNNPGKPKGYMELLDFAQVLGALGTSVTIAAGQSYTVTASPVSSFYGLWQIYEPNNTGSKMYVNIGYNSNDSTFPGVEIVSKIGGIERFISITKGNGPNGFNINNVGSSPLTVVITKII